VQGPFAGGRKWIALASLVAGLALPQAAEAAIPSALGVTCAEQGNGVRFCGSDAPRSTAPAFDGVPIDVNVAFPPAPASGTDGDYPLMMLFHGYGGGKFGLDAMQRWLGRGYATFSMTDRGFRESCGSAESQAAAGGACANGYVRLIDNRYEVRDAQEFAGQLADAGLIDPQRIGSVGGSYGGGMSIALGALRNRKVMPDSSLVPWTSPSGTPMQIAAAAPNIPWTDLAYSLAPNGSTLDYVADAPYEGRLGVEKQSYVNTLYLGGLGAPGFYAPAGSDPTADLPAWRARLDAGEPYGEDVRAIVDELTEHHSSYYIDDSIAPAPMLMSSGFTDDLFPPTETIRYYNRTRTEYPDADLALFFGDFGHPRAQNKSDVTSALVAAENAWMDFYVKGAGKEPAKNVIAYTETCPGTAASGGPYRASDWARMAKGEVRYVSKPAKTIDPGAGSAEVAARFNPFGGGACETADGADQPGTATYRLDPAPAGGYTMLGSATVIAKFTLPGNTSQVAARLLDVAPDGQETLVARGLWRPQTGGPTKQVFQLYPNGWRFAAGHVPKLELLPADSNPGPLGGYGRVSNDQRPVTVKQLELRLPVVEKPGSFGGLVGATAERFLPKGYELAADFAALAGPAPKTKKTFKASGSRLVGALKCPKRFAACNSIAVEATGKAKGRKKPVTVADGTLNRVAGGKTKKLKLKLTAKGRKALAKSKKLKLKLEIESDELAEPVIRRAAAKRR